MERVEVTALTEAALDRPHEAAIVVGGQPLVRDFMALSATGATRTVAGGQVRASMMLA